VGIEIARLSHIDLCDPARMCRLPYPGHPRGCPNFGKKGGCPPGCPPIQARLDLSLPVYAVVSSFDLADHVLRMRLRHPRWTERQLRNCLYWQPRARKRLRAVLATFLFDHPDYIADLSSEAGGVDVTATLRRVGIELEWPPRNIAKQVALAGMPNKENGCPV
jgi:hypothetical protein